MKRLLYCAVAVGVGGACDSGAATSSPTPNGPVTLEFLRHDNPPFAVADDAFITEYQTDHPGVKVNATTVRYTTLGSTLLADLKYDKLTYDLVRIQPSWVCTFADNLADVPSDVVALSEAQNTFFAAPLSGATCGGKLKGLPMEYNLEYGGVVVNLDRYEARFKRMPSWPDWNSFISEAAQLTELDSAGNPAANGLDIAPDWPQPVKHLFFSQILQRNGKYFKADGTFDFQSPEAKASFTEMVKWVRDSKVMYRSLIPDKNTFVTTRLAIGATDYGWKDPARPLSIMGYVGTWGIPSVVSQLPSGNTTRYGYFALPPMVGSQHRFVQNSGWAVGVPKTSKNARAAWDFVKALVLSPEAMRKWSAVTGALPALKANGSVAAATGDPSLSKIQPLLEQGQWVGYIPAGAIETVEGTLVSNYFDAVAGTKTVDEALRAAEITANTALAQNR
jgi:multiple sugar transport system substrate-binding protein